MNTVGGVLFLVGYAVYYNNWVGQKGGNCGCNDYYIWFVCTTFTVGSLCFCFSSYFGLWMWKSQVFATVWRCDVLIFCVAAIWFG